MGNFESVLKQLRTSAGMTQEELAKRLGVSRSTIGMYESGSRKPDPDALEAIADLFNVDIDYLLGRTQKTTLLPESAGKYYLDPESRDLAEFLHKNPKYKVLFDASRKVKPEDIEFVKKMIDRMSGDDYDDPS